MAGHQSTKASSGGPKIDSLNRQVHRSKCRRPGTMIGTRPLAGAHSGRFPGHRLMLVTRGPQWRQDFPNNRPPTRAIAISQWAKTCRPRCKKGRGKLTPQRDATRSHAPQAAVAYCPYSGSDAVDCVALSGLGGAPAAGSMRAGVGEADDAAAGGRCWRPATSPGFDG